MPKEEYNAYHRFKPYYIIGQLDYTKEILIPKKKNGIHGYEVINPLYCYEGGKTSFKTLVAEHGKKNKESPIIVDRAAIIINRGWIPATLKDRSKRPYEINSRELVKMKGVFRAGKDIHDYKIPNNPDNNEWNNLCLEDIGLFWDLPNWDEQKYYYFHAVDLDEGANSHQAESGIISTTRDELIEDHYGWRWTETPHNVLEKTFGAAAAFCTFIALNS
jgi:cytochrome oxidase assembly protein ShyY1